LILLICFWPSKKSFQNVRKIKDLEKFKSENSAIVSALAFMGCSSAKSLMQFSAQKFKCNRKSIIKIELLLELFKWLGPM
jgi:hypothetical protein